MTRPALPDDVTRRMANSGGLKGFALVGAVGLFLLGAALMVLPVADAHQWRALVNIQAGALFMVGSLVAFAILVSR